jgi:hypothetical protein
MSRCSGEIAAELGLCPLNDSRNPLEIQRSRPIKGITRPYVA